MCDRFRTHAVLQQAQFTCSIECIFLVLVTLHASTKVITTNSVNICNPQKFESAQMSSLKINQRYVIIPYVHIIDFRLHKTHSIHGL